MFYDEPRMTVTEFRNRVKPFRNEPPLDGLNGSGFKEAADEIISETDAWAAMDDRRILEPGWWRLIQRNLSNDAIRLGTWILYGDESQDPMFLKLDLSYMPDEYREPFKLFIREMYDIMIEGIDKGYTMQDNYDNGVEWQVAEGKMKFKEFLHLYRAGETTRASRVIIKPATAAFVTYAAFIYNSEGFDWC